MKRALLFALGLATANAVCIPKSFTLSNTDTQALVENAFQQCLVASDSCPALLCEEVDSLPDCVPSVSSLIEATTELEVSEYMSFCGALSGNSEHCNTPGTCDWIGESGGAMFRGSDGSEVPVISQVVQGCTDDTADNYVETATVDDGSCTYTVLGCTDEAAMNFNHDAAQDDGSCTYPVLGCKDDNAYNYNEDADDDDGSCYYNPGCLDPEASNCDPEGDFDDGSCTYPGCTDQTASNYDATATLDDGSCIEQTFVITVEEASSGSGNRYYIDGIEAPELTLYPGKTYVFDLAYETSDHPLAIDTYVDWITGENSLRVAVPADASGEFNIIALTTKEWVLDQFGMSYNSVRDSESITACVPIFGMLWRGGIHLKWRRLSCNGEQT